MIMKITIFLHVFWLLLKNGFWFLLIDKQKYIIYIVMAHQQNVLRGQYLGGTNCFGALVESAGTDRHTSGGR